MAHLKAHTSSRRRHWTMVVVVGCIYVHCLFSTRQSLRVCPYISSADPALIRLSTVIQSSVNPSGEDDNIREQTPSEKEEKGRSFRAGNKRA